MKSLYKYTHILLFLILFISCNEEITLKTDFVPQTFIFGNLTNEAKNLVIIIQESVPVENTSINPKPVKDAIITLFTKNSEGNISVVTDDFIEGSENYTSTQIIDPIIGNFYWIEVVLSDGTLFKSIEEKLKESVPIDKITRINGLTRVTFKDPADDRNFYKLDVSESFLRYGTWPQLSDDRLFNGNDDAFIEIESVNENRIDAMLLNLNYFTYQFYFNLSIQQETQLRGVDDSGDPSQLFAPPPVHLTGNILNTTTNKKALGNFGVVSISFSSIEF